MSLLSSFDLRDSLSFTAIALHKEKLEGSIPFSTLNSLNIFRTLFENKLKMSHFFTPKLLLLQFFPP